MSPEEILPSSHRLTNQLALCQPGIPDTGNLRLVHDCVGLLAAAQLVRIVCRAIGRSAAPAFSLAHCIDVARNTERHIC